MAKLSCSVVKLDQRSVHRTVLFDWCGVQSVEDVVPVSGRFGNNFQVEFGRYLDLRRRFFLAQGHFLDLTCEEEEERKRKMRLACSKILLHIGNEGALKSPFTRIHRGAPAALILYSVCQ